MQINIPRDMHNPENVKPIRELAPYDALDGEGGVFFPYYIRMDVASPVTAARIAHLRERAGAPSNPEEDNRIASELTERLNNAELKSRLVEYGLYLEPHTSQTSALSKLLAPADVAGVIMTTRSGIKMATEDWWVILSDDAALDTDHRVTGRDLKQTLMIASHDLTTTVFLHELRLSELQVLINRVSEDFHEHYTPEEERALSPEHWPLSSSPESHLWAAMISLPDDELMSLNNAADNTFIGQMNKVILADLSHEPHPDISHAYLTQARMDIF